MANDNKKINDLVDESEEDTSELEVLADTVVADAGFDYESESEAATHAFELFETSADKANESVAVLRSELRQRDELVSSLLFDVEQLRARRSGLEKELQAREEITGNISIELRDVQRSLTRTKSLLAERESRIEALDESLRQQSARLAEAERSIDRAGRDAELQQSAINEMRSRYGEATKKIESLQAAVDDEMSRRKRVEDSERALSQRRQQLEEELAGSRTMLGSLEQYIEGRRVDWKKQQTSLASQERTLEEQRRTIARMTSEAAETAELLRDEYAARQEIESWHHDLQQDLARARAEALQLGTIVRESEESLREHEQTIASLTKCLADRDADLAGGQAERQRLTQQLEAQQQHAAGLESALQDLQAVAGPAEAQLQEQRQRLEDLALEAARLNQELADEQSARERLEQELDVLGREADRLRLDNGELETAVARQDAAISEQNEDLGRLQREIDALDGTCESLRGERQSLAGQRDSLQEEAAHLQTELQSLRETAAEAAVLRDEHAKLSGRVAGGQLQISELETRLSQSEGYADELRFKFQQQLAEAEALATALRHAEESCREAEQRAARLGEDLEEERRRNAELAQRLEDSDKRFADQVNELRGELDAVREAAANQEAIAEQLAAELLDSKDQRLSLETRLSESEEAYREESAELGQQAASLRKQVEEYERKLAHKDAAVNALLSELAHKSDSAAAARPADGVVRRLPDRKSQGGDDRGAHDRATRLLVGNIDGQMLRFPLFKDKLTIGRTAHNDIQLKAQYVSRRHAVVIADDDSTRVVDWGSKNGLYVNGTRVTEQTLKNGDRLTIGTAHFRFEERAKR